MNDERLHSIDGYTPTEHHSIPDNVNLGDKRFRPNFTVCIVGAGQGIGEHIAYAYARAGVSNIVIAARSMTDLSKVAQKIQQIDSKITVEFHSCDIASAAAVSDLAEFVQTKFRRLDLLVTNAGFSGPVILKAHEGKPEDVQRAFDVNAMGTYLCAHYFVPLLLASPHGAKQFIAIGSMAAAIRRGPIANLGYCVSKTAQSRIVEYLDEQYGQSGLTAFAIHPGAVDTKMAVTTPEVFRQYLIDDVGLCGAVCTWLSIQENDIHWLGGRLISANWDMQELFSRQREIVDKDLLKLTFAT